MRYIFMNNFRGFTNALIPLKQVNFLVGENSTGKSSFLALLSMLNDHEFWFNPSFQFPNHFTESLYSDLVSAWAKDKTSFQVGVVNIQETADKKFMLEFSVNLFREKDNRAKVYRHSRLDDGEFTSFDFGSPKIQYANYPHREEFESSEDAISKFMAVAHELTGVGQNLSSFPKGSPAYLPLPIATSIMYSLLGDSKTPKKRMFDMHLPMSMDVTWVAPIRTRPRRIYDITHSKYSPEGEHTPLLLRKSLRSKSSREFADKLADFGKISGLFETVVAHSFGKGPKNPFELLIKFKGADLNINNVGYGVSQALPLVVEFLTEKQKRVFAVQQPEVHLHPKAQAALGGLMFQLCKEAKHSFFVETHSDYLIDRFRLAMRADANPPDSQIIFFNRCDIGNVAHVLPISRTGLYPIEQPSEFREFFIKEEIDLLDL